MKLNLKKMLLMFALIPLVTTSLVLGIVTTQIMVNNLEENTRDELKLATKSLREYYEYDLINGENLEDGFIEYEHDYIDAVRETTGVDLTIFKDNVRFVTTIKDDKNERIEGTNASDAVWAAVSKGEDYYSDDVVINGTDYYVYYMPLTDGNKVCGMAFSGKPATKIQTAEKTVRLLVLGICVSFIVIFVFIALFFVKKVASPIKAVAESIDKLSGGDTGITVDATSHIEETVMLIKSAEKLTTVLGEAVGKIRTSANELASVVSNTATLAGESSNATDQIAESMSGLSHTTQTMAESVQDINSSIVEMGQMVEDAAEHTNELHNNAKSMSVANKEASDCISSVASSSDKTSVAVNDIIAKISSTNEAVDKIQEMVQLITEIASQTNLLALNASIEAARAGDAGKGFAVVAEEIGKLATQSNDSANQIKDVVAEISSLSGECVASSEQVRKIIDEEVNLLATTQEKFNVLNNNIESSIENISSITEITSQLETIKDKVTEAVSDLSAISEETSATNEEVTATVESVAGNVREVSKGTEDMNALAGNLTDAVAYFK